MTPLFCFGLLGFWFVLLCSCLVVFSVSLHCDGLLDCVLVLLQHHFCGPSPTRWSNYNALINGTCCMPSVWIDLAKAKRRLEGKKGGTFDFCLPGTAVYSLSTVLWDLSLLTGSLSAPSRTARHQLSHNDGLPLTFEPCPAVLPACHFVFRRCALTPHSCSIVGKVMMEEHYFSIVKKNIENCWTGS